MVAVQDGIAGRVLTQAQDIGDQRVVLKAAEREVWHAAVDHFSQDLFEQK